MFSIPAKTQYAIRAMTCLTRSGKDSLTSVEIAESENIPQKYLEGILVRLKSAGLLESERGQKGGYRIAGNPAKLTMLNIVEAMDGRVKPVICVDTAKSCSMGSSCRPRKFWVGLKKTIDGYLAACTLKDVAEGLL